MNSIPICHKCNIFIGNLENNIDLLSNVFKYLDIDPKVYLDYSKIYLPNYGPINLKEQ